MNIVLDLVWIPIATHINQKVDSLGSHFHASCHLCHYCNSAGFPMLQQGHQSESSSRDPILHHVLYRSPAEIDLAVRFDLDLYSHFTPTGRPIRLLWFIVSFASTNTLVLLTTRFSCDTTLIPPLLLSTPSSPLLSLLVVLEGLFSRNPRSLKIKNCRQHSTYTLGSLSGCIPILQPHHLTVQRYETHLSR